MIDQKWILYCKKKKRNAFVSTRPDRWGTYEDLCSACGHSIYDRHSKAKMTITIPGEIIEVKKGVKTDL